MPDWLRLVLSILGFLVAFFLFALLFLGDRLLNLFLKEPPQEKKWTHHDLRNRGGPVICDKCGKTVAFVYEYTWFNGVIKNVVCYCDTCYTKGLPPPRHQMILVGGHTRILHETRTKTKTGPKPKEKR